MKTILALGLATIFFYPATIYAATDAEVVTEMATKCWEIPENKDIKSASATFELTYNAEGELSRIVAIEYQPFRSAGELFAISAQRALQECASQTSVKSRTIRIVMRITAPQPDGSLLLKKPLR